MLISAQLPGQLSDDEDCRPTKVAATESEMANRYSLCSMLWCRPPEALTLLHAHPDCMGWCPEFRHSLCMLTRRSDLQGQTHASELVWSRSTSQSFIAGHLISPSTSWTGGLAPATPEKAAFRAANPAILAARQGTAATKILGPQEVRESSHVYLLQEVPTAE